MVAGTANVNFTADPLVTRHACSGGGGGGGSTGGELAAFESARLRPLPSRSNAMCCLYAAARSRRAACSLGSANAGGSRGGGGGGGGAPCAPAPSAHGNLAPPTAGLSIDGGGGSSGRRWRALDGPRTTLRRCEGPAWAEARHDLPLRGDMGDPRKEALFDAFARKEATRPREDAIDDAIDALGDAAECRTEPF